MSFVPCQTLEKTAFGETLTAELSAAVTMQFPYSINEHLMEGKTNNAGTLSVSDGLLSLSTGASTNSTAHLHTHAPVRYIPGQGCVIRFTGIFTTGVAGSYQYIGVGDVGDGFFVGYNETAFGVLRRYGGGPEIQTLTVTTGSSHAENITITLDGTDKSDVAVTATGDTTLTANEIAAADYSDVGTGWDAYAAGEKVYFVARTAGNKTGSFTLSGATSAVGTFSEKIAGADPTEVWVPQTSFSEDLLDGTGNIPAIDFTKGNVFQIRYQWLGFGQISFYVENPNTGEFECFHKTKYANTNTIPSIRNPTLPVALWAINTTNATDIVLQSASLGGYIEGRYERVNTLVHGAENYVATVGTETPLLTIRNHLVYNSAINRVRIYPGQISATVEGNQGAIIRIRRNATLTGASFSDVETGVSVMEYDTTATAVSGGDVILTFGLAKSDSKVVDMLPLAIHIDPGETVTISAEALTSTTNVFGSLNWVEVF